MQADGTLTNTFVSCAAPYFGSFYSARIVNDYSGATLNPYFGTYGAIIFFGGGHASTNDNSVIALVLGKDDCTFHRMVDPSPIFGSDASDATRTANSRSDVNGVTLQAYAEYLVDGKPASPHSYGSGDVIGPSEGGAANGTYIRVITGAAGIAGTIGAEVAHKIDFGNLTGFADSGSASYGWKRLANNGGLFGSAAQGTIGAPQWSALVASQNRVYYEARASTRALPPRWFDLAKGSYAVGTGKARTNDSDSPDNGIMFHVPSRNLLVFADCKGGYLRLQYMDVSATQPSWVGGVTLNAQLPISGGWSAACWCADNNRIIVGNVSGDNAAAYEIAIPAALSDVWTVARAPFGNGQSITWFDNCVYKKWTYNPKVRAIVYMAAADGNGVADTVYVYRPRGT